MSEQSNTSDEAEFCASCARHELWEYGWHRAADEAPDDELPALVEKMEQERTARPVPTASGFVYVVHNEDGEPNVFIEHEDAAAFAATFEFHTPISEEPLLDSKNAADMVSDRRGAERGWDATIRKPSSS